MDRVKGGEGGSIGGEGCEQSNGPTGRSCSWGEGKPMVTERIMLVTAVLRKLSHQGLQQWRCQRAVDDKGLASAPCKPGVAQKLGLYTARRAVQAKGGIGRSVCYIQNLL